jgi:hypothetical protein
MEEKKLTDQPLVDTLEEVGWFVTLIILKASIQEGIHTNIITNLFK